MPTYDYICSNCGKTTEIVHSISGSPPSACPACGAEGTLRKAFNPPTIHFKGSGWAKKDRSGSGPKVSRSPDPAATGSSRTEGDGGGGEGSGKSDSSKSESAKSDSKDSSDGGSNSDSSAPAADSKAKPATPAASGPAAD